MTTLELQRRLAALGCDPGPLDGAWGPSTRRALRSFQATAGLEVDGVCGPLTQAALADRGVAPTERGSAAAGEPSWLQEARRRLGLHERADARRLRDFLASDGRTLGDPARAPWCGDFVETCIRVALPEEPVPANPYLARNWLSFGDPCAAPALGAIAVFWRRRRAGPSGHVGFAVGQDAHHVAVLGGNQSDRVSIARIDRRRLLGMRWPRTAGAEPRRSLGGTTGAVTTDEA